MYQLYFWSRQWYELSAVAATTTAAEMSAVAMNRSSANPDFIYGVIEDGRNTPYTLYCRGREYRIVPVRDSEEE